MVGRSATNRLRVCGTTVLGALLLGWGACGAGQTSLVVVRVGHNAITKATVDRWTAIVRRGGAFSGFRGAPSSGTSRQRALALLISSTWLIEEAARQGIPVSGKEVGAALAERAQGAAASEFHKRLAATGQTVAGVELELKAELAYDAIREALVLRASRFTQSEVQRYYREDGSRFSSPKVSVVDIVENLPSAAAATQLVRRIGTGRRFTKVAFRKELAYTTGVLSGSATKKAVDHAIFVARPGVVSRPMRLFGGWTIFVVRRIIPPRRRPLPMVRSELIAGLKKQRTREIATSFAREYQKRWAGVTSCKHGYVVAGCAQYAGPPGAYENPFAGG